MSRDLTKGNPNKVLLSFIAPMLLSVIFQQMYNLADSMIAGKYAGEDALAAVGASYPITMLFMAVALGSNIGCSVVVAGLFGAKDYAKMKTAVSTSFITAGVLAIALTCFGLGFCNNIMRLIKTPGNIFKDSALYLRIYIGGFIFLFLYNIATGVFNSLGDSKTPLYFLIFSSVGNIILDIVFVKYLELGVAGVAWATFMAQGIACLLAIFTLFVKLAGIETETRPKIFSGELLYKIGRIALPSIAQQSFISVGNVFIQSIVNSLDSSSIIAGYSAGVKLNSFVLTCLTTVGNGVSNYSGQNKGAGNEERIKEGFRAGIRLAIAISFVFTIIMFTFRKTFISMFLDEDATQKALESGAQFLMVLSPFYMVISVKLAADGVLRGTGALTDFMIATFADLILRVILAYIFSGAFDVIFGRFLSGYGYDASFGIWLSWPLSWVVGAGLSYFFYKRGHWKKSVII